MSVIQDFRKEIIEYPDKFCKIEIVDINPEGNIINKNEEFTFKIKVKNLNCVDMINVQLEALGTDYVSVHKHLNISLAPPQLIDANILSMVKDQPNSRIVQNQRNTGLTATKQYSENTFNFQMNPISQSFNLTAFSEHTTGVFHGIAKNDTDDKIETVVTAKIIKWDASLDHLLTDHSNQGSVRGKLKVEIHEAS